METMENPKYLELMSKYLSGNIDRAEREELMSWAESSSNNQAFFDEMIQLWGMTGDVEEEAFAVDNEAAWDRLEQRLDLPSESVLQTKVRPLYYRTKVWAVAASIAVVLTFAWLFAPMLFTPSMEMVATQSKERKEVLLPDGTKVWLNGNSTLAYSPRFKERKVELQGEAYFDVASIPDRPFSIQSGDVETRVLGTVFNIRAYPEEESVEVTVEEGLVEVALRPQEEIESSPIQGEAIRLEPGNAVVVDKQTQELEILPEEDISIAMAWQRKKLIFDDEPMNNVVKTLERYFEVSIEMDPQKYRDCPISFEEDNPELEDVFTILEAVFDYQIDQTNQGRFILEGGVCN